MAKYYLTRKAIDDLSDIWFYTVQVWSEKQADKYYSLLIDSFNEISKNPDIGKRYDGILDSLLGFGVGKHIVFYRSLNKSEVEIIRVLHEMMDIPQRMKE